MKFATLVFNFAMLACSAGATLDDEHSDVDLPDFQVEPWGHYWADDPIEEGVTEKDTISLLHGWAMQGEYNENTEMIEPWFTNITSIEGAAFLLRGRCGRFDGLQDNAYYPCLLPYGRKTSGGKTWKWKIDFSGCPLNSTERSTLEWGANRAFVIAADNTGWAFTKVGPTNSANIIIKCSSLVETNFMMNNDLMGAGYPSGPLGFEFSAPFFTFDQCNNPNFQPTGAKFWHATNGYYYYTNAKLVINWFKFWSYVYNCPQSGVSVDFEKRAATTLFMHELGHILGFTHHTWPNGTIMQANRSCNFLNGNWFQYSLPMREALQAHDFPVPLAPNLQAVDSDLACHSPE